MGEAVGPALTCGHREVLARSDLLLPLAPEVVDDLLVRMQVGAVPAGAALFPPGQGGHRLWLVLEGGSGCSIPRSTGCSPCWRPATPIGEAQVFDPRRLALHRDRDDPAVVAASAGREDVLEWVGRHPAVSARLLQRMARRLARQEPGRSRTAPPRGDCARGARACSLSPTVTPSAAWSGTG